MKNALASLLCLLCLAGSMPAAEAQIALPTPAAPPPSSETAAESSPASTVIERVLVRVNGEIFTQTQLTTRQINALRELKQGAETNIEEELASLTPDLLVTAVDELLLVQQGREMGFTFTEEQFQSAVSNIKERNNLDDEGLARALAQDGWTMEALRKDLETNYLIQGVQQREIGPSMTITLEEQRQYYKRNGDEFMTPLTVTLRELFLSVPTVTQNNKEVFSVADANAAEARMEEYRARALAGEDFAALVTANSESATRESGGLIGPVNVDDLSPALQELTTSLEPGGISEPLRTARGFQLFKLESRSVPELRPFDEVRRDIENAIRNERIGPETEKLLARLRTEAVIEWKDESFRQVYEQAIAEAAAP